MTQVRTSAGARGRAGRGRRRGAAASLSLSLSPSLAAAAVGSDPSQRRETPSLAAAAVDSDPSHPLPDGHLTLREAKAAYGEQWGRMSDAERVAVLIG